MKSKTLLLALIGGSLTFTMGLWLYSTKAEIKPLMLVISGLVLLMSIAAIVIALKRMKEEKEGFVLDDEMSMLMKYKAGYYAYLASMYVWFFIFVFKDLFSKTEALLGTGILLSALVFFITKLVVKKQVNG